MRSLDLKSGVLVKTTAFVLGMGAACLIGFVRPGSLFENSKISKEQSSAPGLVTGSGARIEANRAAEAPAEGPLDRFRRNLRIAASTGEESDKQYLANQLDLFSIKATPRFRSEVLAADKDLQEVARIVRSGSGDSPVLARAAARFLAVSAADLVIDRNYPEARRLLSLSERLQSGLDVQRTVRAALLKVNARSEDLLFRTLPESTEPESLVERILSFVLGVIILAIVSLAAVFGYVFYRRVPGLSGISSAVTFPSSAGSGDESGYIGKIRKLVVVPGKGGVASDSSTESRTPPDDEPTPPELESSVKLRRAA